MADPNADVMRVRPSGLWRIRLWCALAQACSVVGWRDGFWHCHDRALGAAERVDVEVIDG